MWNVALDILEVKSIWQCVFDWVICRKTLGFQIPTSFHSALQIKIARYSKFSLNLYHNSNWWYRINNSITSMAAPQFSDLNLEKHCNR